MSEFFEQYKEACKQLRKECDKIVENGELTESEANFRYEMVKDEILMAIPE